VEEGASGYLIDPEDGAAWAQRLVELARDPKTRRRLGQRAHEVTLTRTPERTAEGYAEAVDASLRLSGPAKR
jgi:glycosyltransferase involved in cell wall biosynthesis